MAKLLFINVPAHGHVNPTLPVAVELVRRGHEVVYYNGETFAEKIRAAGARFCPYPASGGLEAELAGRIGNLVDVSVFLMEKSFQLVPFLLEEIDREQPAGVVFDSIALWGMLAARIHRVPSAASISTLVHDGVPGILQPRDYLHIFRQALTRLARVRRLRAGLVQAFGAEIFPGKSILPTRGDVQIVYTSREFQPDTPFIDPSFHFVGPSILPSMRGESGFPWERLDLVRPKIYLSLGTLYNDRADFYRAILAAFRGHPAQLILSVGRSTDPRQIGSLPENVILQPSVPQLEVLSKIDLFITHGGMNSIHEGLYYGVPLVVVPQQIEQAMNGRVVARQGAGVILGDRPPYGKVSAGELRTVVDRVLADLGYRERARSIGDTFRAAGGYAQAAAVIESIC